MTTVSKFAFRRLLGIVPCAASSLILSTASANIIDDTFGVGAGSFELGSYVDGGGNPNSAGAGYMGLFPGDNTTITGWTVGGPGDGVDWLVAPIFRADTGIHALDLQHLTDSSISTVIPTIAGNVYQLSFAAAAVLVSFTSFFNNVGTVSAGSLVNQAFVAPFSATLGNQAFVPLSFQFTATAPTTTIRFTSTGPNSAYGPVIDSVSVVSSVSSVPEPSSVALLLVGFGVLGAVAQSGRSRSARSR